MIRALIDPFVPQTLKNIFHAASSFFAACVFGFPARKMRIVGVTGTDGKTTTVQCLSAILIEAGHRVAVASSVNFRRGEEEWVNTSKFTTLSAWKLERFLREAVSSGCEYAVLEVSSHAIDQGRILGISFDIAVITNVTREHLDYHHTLEVYRSVKKKLLQRAKKAVVNLDMDRPHEFLAANPGHSITYSRLDGAADVFAEKIASSLSGSTFTVEDTVFRIALPGMFNVENALAAIATATALGISRDVSSSALRKISGVPGRMEFVPNDRGLTILIDYAVTPNALENLYRLVSEMRLPASAKIIAVFGACGDRDRGKRPLMGEIVSSVADIVLLTNEDPYTEDPQQIVEEVRAGISNKILGKTLFILLDRRDAIRKALSLASLGDIVVVTGKGAEETMAVGDARIPWNDKRVILEELQ